MRAKYCFLGFFLALLLWGCSLKNPQQPATHVNLGYKKPLPALRKSELRPLRVAIAAVISPKGSAESYAPLLGYLEVQLGRPVEAVHRRTYSEINELIRRGEVDLAFVCTSAYLRGREEFGMQLLVAPQVNSQTVYRSNLIVPAESTVHTLPDLRGKVFAFADPMSLSGRMYPMYLLQQMGETPETFFDRTYFTYSHDDSIYAVANGLADGAAVDSLVLDFAFRRDPDLAEQVRVIHTSDPFGIPPVVVGPDLRPQLRLQLEELFLNMHQDPAGREALAALGLDRFVRISESAYESAEVIEAALWPALEGHQP